MGRRPAGRGAFELRGDALAIFDSDRAARMEATTGRNVPRSANRAAVETLLFDSRPKGGFLEREHPPVGVERISNAERNGSEVLAVTEREVVENGHAEGLEVFF